MRHLAMNYKKLLNLSRGLGVLMQGRVLSDSVDVWLCELLLNYCFVMESLLMYSL